MCCMRSCVIHCQLARSGARCDYGLFVGASADNAQTLPPLARDAVALKMYLNDTFTTLRMDSITQWMKVRQPRSDQSPSASLCIA